MRRGIALVLTCTLAACGGRQYPDPDEPASLTITTDRDEVLLEVEVADTDEERRRGLMGRDHLAPNDGMAFVFDEPVSSGFWMKDTLIPLSIAFWNERGRIVAILDMDPCEADPCPVYEPGIAFVGAVEVRQGLFELRGVKVGDRVELLIANA
ncbi:MAG: DUF192 domain-containing protein [Actinomycetota bacterium]